MFRFTIRDVLWLTVVVGLGCGWWLSYRHWSETNRIVAADRGEWIRRAIYLKAMFKVGGFKDKEYDVEFLNGGKFRMRQLNDSDKPLLTDAERELILSDSPLHRGSRATHELATLVACPWAANGRKADAA